MDVSTSNDIESTDGHEGRAFFLWIDACWYLYRASIVLCLNYCWLLIILPINKLDKAEIIKHRWNTSNQTMYTKYIYALPYFGEIKLWQNTEVHFYSFLKAENTKIKENTGNTKMAENQNYLINYLTMSVTTYIIMYLKQPSVSI